MKYLDSIVVTTNKYKKEGIKKGTKGVIIMAEIRKNTFECELFDVPSNAEIHEIGIDEMEVTKTSKITDEDILEELPKNNPNWWCKVEDGYILNLKGDKKNKIPYDYKS